MLILIPWRVTHLFHQLLGIFSSRRSSITSIPGDCGRSFIDQLRRCTIRTPQAGCENSSTNAKGFQRKNMGYWYEFYKEHWWNDIMKSLYKSFKCDSVIYDCSFFFGFPRIVGKLPKMNQQLQQLILGGATIWHDEMRVLRPWAAACECWKIRSLRCKEMFSCFRKLLVPQNGWWK